jgi:hypothetical protein
VLAYDSFSWPPSHDGWPVSFFVVALTLVCYVLAQFAPRRRPARRETAIREPVPAAPRPEPGWRAEPGPDLAAEFRIGR